MHAPRNNWPTPADIARTWMNACHEAIGKEPLPEQTVFTETQMQAGAAVLALFKKPD